VTFIKYYLCFKNIFGNIKAGSWKTLRIQRLCRVITRFFHITLFSHLMFMVRFTGRVHHKCEMKKIILLCFGIFKIYITKGFRNI